MITLQNTQQASIFLLQLDNDNIGEILLPGIKF